MKPKDLEIHLNRNQLCDDKAINKEVDRLAGVIKKHLLETGEKLQLDTDEEFVDMLNNTYSNPIPFITIETQTYPERWSHGVTTVQKLNWIMDKLGKGMGVELRDYEGIHDNLSEVNRVGKGLSLSQVYVGIIELNDTTGVNRKYGKKRKNNTDQNEYFINPVAEKNNLYYPDPLMVCKLELENGADEEYRIKARDLIDKCIKDNHMLLTY